MYLLIEMTWSSGGELGVIPPVVQVHVAIDLAVIILLGDLRVEAVGIIL